MNANSLKQRCPALLYVILLLILKYLVCSYMLPGSSLIQIGFVDAPVTNCFGCKQSSAL